MSVIDTDLISTLTTTSTITFPNVIKQMSIAANIPPEIFIKICEYLPPSDLLTLTGVCKRFRNFLCSPESPITQDIWRISRIQFLPGLQLPPPKGMYEEQYIRFGSLLTKCQYCYTRKTVKIYWQFLVRCCYDCLIKNTTAISLLFFRYSKDQNWTNDNVLTGLVYVRNNSQILFWTPDVKSSFKEFEAISGSHYNDWVEKRKENRIRIMEDATQRDLASANAEDTPTMLLNHPNTEITRTISTSLIPATITTTTSTPITSITASNSATISTVASTNTQPHSIIHINTTINALAAEVGGGFSREFSQIRSAGTRSTLPPAAALSNFGRINSLDIMITDSP